MDGGAWWAAIHGVAKSRKRLNDFSFTFHFHALDKEMATHSSVLAWRIPGPGESGGLLSMGSHRVSHDWRDLAVTSVWDECNCAVVWAFFGIAFLWDWNKNWLFQSCGHCRVFQICWHIECSTFTASSFRIWNCSTGIPSPPLVLFIVMLPKAHLTSHSRMWRWL